MNFSEVLTKNAIYLNLGGGDNCHPKVNYKKYISVDIKPPREGWSVKHDIRESIPLPDNTVTRILSEDFMEHLQVEEIETLLGECFRLLKPQGKMRIGVPDYNNPKDRPYLKKGKDERHPDHITLTNYKLMENIIKKSPFSGYKFYHYWDEGKFVWKKIDYSLGMIKRTPDNDPRCRAISLKQKIRIFIADFLFKLVRGYQVSKEDLSVRRGHPLYVTSLVVDLFKDE